MNIPAFTAEAALSKTSTHYRFATSYISAAYMHLSLSQLAPPALLRTPIICNGNCPPPICHFHCGPCGPNPNVPSNCGRTCCSFGPGCEDPGCSVIDCGSGACCPITCNSAACTCGTYPNCQATGMKTCTDCRGNPAPPQPC
jgi:hypothetical protein